MSVTEEEELRGVMTEIAEAMSANGTTLSIHPQSDAPPRFLYDGHGCGMTPDLSAFLIERIDRQFRSTSREDCQWFRHGLDGAVVDLLCMPVQPIEGHSRLVVTAIFGALSEDQRQAAEAVYLRRRPFAVGYFRLWQQDRARLRHANALEEALNIFDTGVLLLNRRGDIAFANRVATRRLDDRDGIKRHQSGLIATDFDSSMRLQVALDHSLQQHGRTVLRRAPLLLLRRPSGLPLIVSVLPTSPAGEEPADVAAVLFLVEAMTEINRLLEPICRLHGLSPIETGLVCLLAGGESIKEAAGTLRIKEQAARSCLKQAFVKTGTHRQVDLVRVMLSSIVRMTPDVSAEVMPFDRSDRLSQ